VLEDLLKGSGGKMLIRLDKFLCDTLNLTRTQAKKKLSAGKVTLCGAAVKSGNLKIDPEKSVVCVNEIPICYTKYTYLIMNKPAGCVCANSDRAQTVFDLLDNEHFKKDLFCVGRLDKDTTGLLILTNDGDFSHRIISPKSRIKKVYRASLESDFTDSQQQSLEDGITLADGTVCLPAQVEKIDNKEILITVFEGKYHQVKRMVAASGNKVVSLSRKRIGNLCLDENLPRGAARKLTDSECEKIFE
jgi:16S rRNA pseudouridine516 synthase